MFKKLLAISALLWSVSCFAGAEIKAPTEKKYPPYPNVWGYDLTDYPAVRSGPSGINAYQMEDGDIWFVFLASYDKELEPLKATYEYTNKKYILLKFFTGEKIELTKEDQKKLDNIPSKWIGIQTDADQVNFSDGSSLKIGREYGGGRLCSHLDFIGNFLIKTGSNKTEKQYVILASYPGDRVLMMQDNAGCEFEGMPFLYQKLYLLSEHLIDLGDDTFIAYSTTTNVIIRFDKNFNTKFIPVSPLRMHGGNYINRNFFVVEYDEITKQAEKIREGMPYYQSLHDNLLVYLEKKYQH